MIDPDRFPAFRDTLISGGYNLLLGAGVVLDSIGPDGNRLLDGEALSKRLCRATGAPEGTSLARVARILTGEQRDDLLVRPFAPCTPGPSIARLPNYIWRRLFTFNIDDSIEQQYERDTKTAKQAANPLNFDSPFEPTPERDQLQIIHLHGFAREPEAGFVFSHQEYARVLKGGSPWMHMLASILATEPFIIAGSKLDEVDLEYYLQGRTPSTPRRGTGPSILVEPFADVVTRADCARHGLELVEAPVEEFMEWVGAQVPTPPTVADLLIPDAGALFDGLVPNLDKLRFFSAFELVEANDLAMPQAPSAFFYGKEPTWRELDQHLDIPRESAPALSETVGTPGRDSEPDVILLGAPGAGKTTLMKRIAHAKTRAGVPVLSLSTFSGIDLRATRTCLSGMKAPVLLHVDNVADHAGQLRELLEDREVRQKVRLLAADREYRRQHIELLLGKFQPRYIGINGLTQGEAEQLIERFRQFALIGKEEAIRRPERFAERIRGCPLTEAVCLILNDFRPLDDLVQSLWQHTPKQLRDGYLAVALAQYCHWTGLRYSIAQSIIGPADSVDRLLSEDAPLRLTDKTVEDAFVLTLNWAIGERVLHLVANKYPERLYATFVALGRHLAPLVNRRAIIRRAPEARLAGRLFDLDTVVKPFLGDRALEFYRELQAPWEWNSRYWEQRALLQIDLDVDTAIRHARQALAIERHPFGLTTLGKVLTALMEHDLLRRDEAYADALDALQEAIEAERGKSRTSVHPFMTLIVATSRFLELEGVLDEGQWQRVVRYANEADRLYPDDQQLQASLRALDGFLQGREEAG